MRDVTAVGYIDIANWFWPILDKKHGFTPIPDAAKPYIIGFAIQYRYGKRKKRVMVTPGVASRALKVFTKDWNWELN